MTIDTTIDRTIIGKREFCKIFLCSEADIVKWRALGMPYIKTDCIYEYRVVDCQAWFAGTYHSNKGIDTVERAEPNTLKGYVSQGVARDTLGIGSSIITECRLAGMPYKRKGKAYMYNIPECIRWIKQSEAFKHRIKWCAKRGDNNAGE